MEEDLERRLPGDVRDKEVHGNVLAVHVLVHHLPHLLWLPVGVQVGVDLREREGEGERGRERERINLYLVWFTKYIPCGRRQPQ